MAYSYSEHPSVGVGQTLPLGFLYEPTSTVRVLVDGVLVPEILYFWSSNTEITTLTGFPVGAVTKVERFTPIDEYNAQNGTSVYDFEGVNLNFQQLLYALQESRDNEDIRQQQIDDIEDTAEALSLGLAQVDQIKADVEDLAQAAADSAAQAATFDPANFYTKGQADARYFTQSQVNTFLSTKADNAITVTGAGLATGGGSLAANRTITVPKATDAESVDRVTPRDDVAMTPKGVGLALPAYNKWRMIEDVDLVSVASYIRTGLTAFEAIRLDGEVVNSATAANGIQLSTDDGASWITSGYMFNGGTSTETTSIAPGYNGAVNSFTLHPNALTASTSFPHKFLITIGNLNKALPKTALLLAHGVTSGSLNASTFAGLRGPNSLVSNAIRLLPGAGVFSRVTLTLEGKEG